MIKIPITKPVFGDAERAAVQAPLETGWVVQGPFVQQFEERFRIFTGAASAVATTSCTTALHLAVAALGLKADDEVIVPAFTWISTANVVEYMGGRPVFCDIDLATYNLDVSQLAACVTSRTVGIIPVHLFGLAAEMDPILAIAERHGLWVIEDAACGFGSRYHGRHVGTFGDSGCFSFHPRKSITTGEGGMIVTSRRDLEVELRSLRDHGAEQSDHKRHTSASAFLLSAYRHLGYNYRMTDIQGALGCAQMDRADAILAERARRAGLYDISLTDVEWLQRPAVPKDYVHGYQAYVCLFRPQEPSLDRAEALHEQRNRMMVAMEQEGIATRQGTHAAALQPYYATKYGIRPEDVPRAYLADRLTVTLPLYPQMTDDEQALVCDNLRKSIDA